MTIEEAKENYVINLENTGILTKQDIIEQNLNAFDAGVEYATQLIDVNDELPSMSNDPFAHGCSDYVLLKDCNLYYRVGYMDFEKTWYDIDNNPINIKILFWRSI